MPVGDPQPPGDDPLIGRVLSDRYRILRKVGEGGMGVVYLAEHALIEKKVALKILFPELTRRTDLVARFLQEAKSASRIGHENVIDISDFGQSPDGLVYIAMEYLDGQDLGQILKAHGAMPWLRARPILMQIVKALRAAHDHGIIHRDMKPENIFLIQREARPDFVKVLDFGIAKVVNLDEDGPRLTQTGMIFGTPEYMSPEQAQGQTPDNRVDIYAVGCIMYHLLTGQVPFTSDSFMGILTKHMLDPIIPPRQRRPDLDIPEDVEAIVLRALQKDRAGRWQDMNAFYQAMVAAGDEILDLSGPHRVRAETPAPVVRTATATAAPATKTPEARSTEAQAEILDLPDTQEMLARAGSRTARSKLLTGIVVAAVLGVAIVGGIVALSSSGTAPAPSGGTAASAVPAPPPPAPTTAPPAPPVAPAAVTPPSPTAAAAAGSTAPPSPAPARGSSRRQRSSAEAVKALTGGDEDESGGTSGKPARSRPSTPAELKDPFNSQ